MLLNKRGGNNDDELYHHGIKGQKWGIRRYQKSDGSLTSAGKRRYGSKSTSLSPNDINTITSVKYSDMFDKISEYNSDKKLKNILSIAGYTSAGVATVAGASLIDPMLGISVALSSSPLMQDTIAGLTKNIKNIDANQEAYTNELVKRILDKNGDVMLNEIMDSNKKSHYSENTDTILEKGTLLKRITGTSDVENYPIYVSGNEVDNNKFKSDIGYSKKVDYEDVYEKTFKVNDDIKVASIDKARETVANLINSNESFKNDVLAIQNQLVDTYKYGEYSKLSKNAQQSIINITNNNITKDTYETINAMLADHSITGVNVSSTLYKELAKSGYGAISDMFDSNNTKYSNSYSTDALIVFDSLTNKNSISQESIRELDTDELYNALLNKQINSIIRQ